MRRACIDIGSNTTRLLVADVAGGGLVEVHQERAFTRLGRAVARDGGFPAGKLDELGQVVAAQLERARQLGATDVRCVATACVRHASNADELVSHVRARCGGLDVEVLSEQDEARLAFAGAARTLNRASGGPLAVLDVGGGSCELAVGTAPDRVSWWRSVRLGSGELTDACVRSDPPSAGELAALRTRASAALVGLAPPRVALALAVGGGATSVRQLAGPRLDAAAIAAALSVLTAAPAAEVAARLGLDLERVKLLPAGLVILGAFSTLLGAPLQISAGGLREGALLEGA